MDGIGKGFFGHFTVFTTGLVIGLLAGITGMNILVSYRIDKYHQDIKHLENIISDRNIKLEKLQESINKSKFIINDIQVVFNFECDELDKIEIEKAIKKKYSSLLGKEVKSIDADMVAEVVDKRIMRVNSREYKLNVGRIIVSDVIKIWLNSEMNY